MKIKTSRLFNFWRAESDPSFVDLPVHIGKRFDGNYAGQIWDEFHGKFHAAAFIIPAKIGERLEKRGTVDGFLTA